MSLDKAIQAGKEHRKPWRKAARFDPACRPGGDCPYCKGNRLHQQRKEEERTNVEDATCHHRL